MDTIIDRFDGTKYTFLSNFYPAPMEYEGLLYPTSEHAYQAAKTTDQNLRKIFTDINMTCAKSKKVGRSLVLRDNWDDIKAGIMLDIVRIKFSTHPKLAEKLLATGDASLIEGNTWGDVFFGVCNGVGKNWLGRILMHVRSELRCGKQLEM